MKTIPGLILVFSLIFSACGKPPFQDRPVQPEISGNDIQLPVIRLPWHVLKGIRIAEFSPARIPQIFLQNPVL